MGNELVGINGGRVTTVDPVSGLATPIGSSTGLSYNTYGEAALDSVFYFSNPGGFYSVNLSSGLLNNLSANQYNFVADSETGLFIGNISGNFRELISIDPQSGAYQTFVKLDGVQGFTSIAATAGHFFLAGADATGATRIYTVDLQTKNVQSVASLAQNFAADDATGSLIGIQGQVIQRIDPTTGGTTAITTIPTLHGYFLGGEAAENGNFYFDAPDPTGQTLLYTVNTLTGAYSSVVSNTANLNPSQQMMCFRSSTRIRISSGDRAVDDLKIGDNVVTASGKLRPVRWIGCRTVECNSRALTTNVWPVRVRRAAFGGGRPARDLFLSPGHPVLVNGDEQGEGGVLVPVMLLVNGVSIERVKMKEVTYWHFELDEHNIVFAEDLPVESYIDLGSRSWFESEGDHIFDPDLTSAGKSGRCRKVILEGPILDCERARLDAVLGANIAFPCAWPSLDQHIDWRL